MHGVETLEQRKAIKPFLLAWFFAVAFYTALARTVEREFCLYYDFRAFYAAGVLLRTDREGLYSLVKQELLQNTMVGPAPVLPFFHPAYEAILFAPFSLFPYPHAYVAFTLFNLVFVALTFWVGRDVFSATLPSLLPRSGLMLFLYFPLMIAVFLDRTLSCFCFYVVSSGDASRPSGRV